MTVTELAVGNIVRRVLHIIREEDLSSTTTAIEGLGLSDDDADGDENEDYPALSAAVLAAAARSTLRAPSLQTLLEDIPVSAAAPPNSSSGGDSEGRSKCMISSNSLLFSLNQFVLTKKFVFLNIGWSSCYISLGFHFCNLKF